VFAAFIKVTSQDKLLMEAEEAQNRVILRRWARSKYMSQSEHMHVKWLCTWR